MIASSKKELQDSNVFHADGKFLLLKSSGLYGANASGKSNLLKAMSFFRNFVLSSSKETQATEKIRVSRFKLSSATENEPCFFEIVFIQNSVRYKYGFQVDKDIVHREWLLSFPKGKETTLFTREQSNFKVGTYYKEGHGLTEKTRPNALFLSVVAQFNGTISMNILEWFKKFRIISAADSLRFAPIAIEGLKDPAFKVGVLNFIKAADLGIEDLTVEEIKTSADDAPDFIRSKIKDGNFITNIKISTAHKKYDKDNNYISPEQFDLGSEESEGTKKFFGLSGPILDSIKNGYVLAIDELDSKLHPLLMQFIIKMFNSNNSNPKNSQLVFTSHGTSLLHRGLLRRDQIWFTEKNTFGATSLYSLSDYKVRKDAPFEKDYMLGKYGATPYLSTDFNPLSEGSNEE
jgi:hypothetical protein